MTDQNAFDQNNAALVTAGFEPVVDFGSPAAADTDGGVDILSQEGRRTLRDIETEDTASTEFEGFQEDSVPENDGMKDTGSVLYDGNPFGYPTDAQKRSILREGLIHKVLGNEPTLSTTRVKEKVADLASFIETGEFETTRETALKHAISEQRAEINEYEEQHISLDDFLQTHFPKEFARRISTMNLVKELLITGFDLGDENDPEDDEDLDDEGDES